MAITIDVSDVRELMVEFTREFSKTSRDIADLVEQNERLKNKVQDLEGQKDGLEREIESLKGDYNYYRARCEDIRQELLEALEKIRNFEYNKSLPSSSTSLILQQFLNLMVTNQDHARKVLDLLYDNSKNSETGKKIDKIKAIRNLLNIGLKESKEFVEGNNLPNVRMHVELFPSTT